MRPYEEIDKSVPDLKVNCLPGRLAALTHPLNYGRDIILPDRESYDPDVCTVVSSGIRGFNKGDVVVLAPDHGAFYPTDERELRIIGVVKPWYESVLGKWSEDGFAPAPGWILIEREQNEGWFDPEKTGIILPDTVERWSSVGTVVASHSDAGDITGERVVFTGFDFYTFKECLPESWCLVKARDASRRWLNSLAS